MGIILTVIHVFVCLFLVVIVLLQSGKAADLAGAFGGMGSQTVFGPRGSATVLSKATTIAAAVFMVTSLSLSILATRNGPGTTAATTGSSNLLKQGKAGAAAPKGPQPGQSLPLNVTPQVNGVPQPPQKVNAPVIPAPPPGQKPSADVIKQIEQQQQQQQPQK